ncbi:TrmH family RNA methyltransferase [Nitratifractor sp.]
MKHQEKSREYLKKKAFYDRVLTLYGRNPVLEALKDPSLTIHRLHLSRSNRPSKELDEMLRLAVDRGVEVLYHDKAKLSRISKNARQDQGVALDIVAGNIMRYEDFISKNISYRILALDRITNPQNVGMILRSAAAGKIDGVLIPAKGTAPVVSPLTIKASAGTLFRLPLLRCGDLREALRDFREAGATLFTLDSHASKSYDEVDYPAKTLFVLGNESEGVSPEVAAMCHERIAIPMNRGVESLNVAVTAALLAFCTDK